MYHTRVRFACPIYFSRDQSSSKLIIFLDSKLERSNSRVAKIDSRLDSRNFRGSRIESRVEFRNSRVTVNLPLSGTVVPGSTALLPLYIVNWSAFSPLGFLTCELYFNGLFHWP